MNYINTTTNQYPVSENEIRATYPNTSFSVPFQAPEPYVGVFPAPTPMFDHISQSIREVTPILTNKGHWEQVWEVASLSVEQIAINKAEFLIALQTSIVQATQSRLDTFARARNYDSILSACTYATSAVPQFAAEGQIAVDARDATWMSLYTLLAEIQAGTRDAPTSFEDIELLLPELTW